MPKEVVKWPQGLFFFLIFIELSIFEKAVDFIYRIYGHIACYFSIGDDFPCLLQLCFKAINLPEAIKLKQIGENDH